MAEEFVTILKVDTSEPIKNINDLKNNVKALKDKLGELAIGSTDYQQTLEDLKMNQNALKDAMYATKSSMDEVSAAALGASSSYNSLVHKMAELKTEWRATNDEARRNELGKQIADINQELKNMDASVGNFQRNVGNYESGVSGLVEKFDSWGSILKQMPPTLGATKESIGKVGETMQLVGKQPILGIIGLLAPIIMKITESLKDNETAMSGVKKIMELMQPVWNFLNGILEKIAVGFVNLVTRLTELVGGNGWFSKVVTSVTGVGNALLQYLLVPVRTTIEAFQGLGNIMKDVFTGQWGKIKEDAQVAWQGIKEAFTQGFSFQENFQFGKEWGKAMVDGISSNKPEAEQAAEEIAEATTKPIKRQWKEIQPIKKEQESAEKKFHNEIMQQIEERNAKSKEEHDAEVERARTRIETMDAVASATSSILSSIADMYEANSQGDEKAAKKAKALRIASATIDMLQGAVTAFTSAMSLGPIAGPIVGAANAAAVVAMGIANINKIKSTNMNASAGESGSGGDASAIANSASQSVSRIATSASQSVSKIATSESVVNAPDIETGLQTVRTATSASEEDRLNRMASSQKVYILQSDLEAASMSSKAVVAEASF